MDGGYVFAVQIKTSTTNGSQLTVQREASSPTAAPGDRDKLIDIYVDDHWAGAAAGVALAKRLAAHNQSTQWHGDFVRIARAIQEDQESLAKIRDRRGRPRSTVKRALAVVAERVGRLKLNGRVLKYSPLSRVIEIEVLMSGVQAKQLMWRALQQIDTNAFDVDLGELEGRAVQQLADLDRIHDQAARMALASQR